MKRTHGKAKSACHEAKLRLEQNGEWQEQYCTECGQPVHPDGKVYSYLIKDPYQVEPKT